MSTKEISVGHIGGIVILSLLLLNAQSVCCAAPGQLDPTFGNAGEVQLGFGGGHAQAYAVAVGLDGKLLLGGFGNGQYPSTGGDFLIAQFGTNNLLDPSFGDGGKVITVVSTNHMNSQSSVIKALAVQGDGKIVAAGYCYQKTNYTDFTLARYNPDGSLDTTFGTNGTGIVYTDFGYGSQISAMTFQNDGKIVVDGNLGPSSGHSAGVALARYQTNGMLDAAFGTGGIIAMPGSEYDQLYGLTIEPDQQILAVGSANGAEFAIYRFSTNGTPDPAFGGGTGHVFTSFGVSDRLEQLNAVAIQFGTITTPDQIVATGYYSDYSVNPIRTYLVLIRYSYFNGTIDTSIGNNGIVTNLVGNGIVSPTGLFVGGQGTGLNPTKITVGGSVIDSGTNYFGLDRFTGGGTLDTTFGANNSGKITLAVGRVVDGVDAATGQIVLKSGFALAGYRGFSEGGYDFAAAHFTSTGVIDNSFGTNGLLLADVSDPPSQARAVAVQPDGKIIAAGHASYQTNSTRYDRFALARLNPDGSLDASFGSNGKQTVTLGSQEDDDAYAAAVQPDGKIIVAGSAANGNMLALLRYNADSSTDLSFGSNGLATLVVGNGNDVPNRIQFQPDGKIVVAGYANDSTGNSHFAVARFTTNGLPDATFGTAGQVVTSVAIEDEAFGAGILPDGKIVLGGFSASSASAINFAAVRYTTNGVPDSSFGFAGRTTANVGGGTLDIGYAMALQPDGKILLAGGAGFGTAPGFSAGGQAYVALLRLNTNASIDTSFASGGSVITQVGADNYDYATSLTLQPDGKILVAGVSQNHAFDQFFTLRYNGDGSVDDSYGTNGSALISFGSGTNELAYGLALDSTGRAVLAGDAGGVFGVARVLGDLQPGPTLKILLTTTNAAIVSWPYPSTGWTLQQDTGFDGTIWATPPETVDNDGTNNFIIISPPSGVDFYRLIWQ